MPKRTARAKVTRRTVNRSGSGLSPQQIKLGLGLLGIILLFVLPIVGVIIIAAVLFHHFFMGKDKVF